jgi:uncharacterized RDD family membrane protein YckC
MTDLPPPPVLATPPILPPPPMSLPAPHSGLPYRHPAPVLVGGLPLASPWERLAARLLDGLIISAVTVVPFLVVVTALLFFVFAGSTSTPSSTSAAPGDGAADISIALRYVVLYLVLFTAVVIAQTIASYWLEVVYQGRHGQTIGKRTLKIHVVPLTAGARVDRELLRRRWLATNWVQLVLCIPILGWFLASILAMYNTLDGLWLLWDKPFQQCLHDKYAQTTVVKVAS